MKKALGVFLMTAMAFGAFAEEPVADVKIAEFSGNAAVQWGVDLDSGTTGFKNSYEVNLKLNLLNNGTKSTTGDGVWGELVLKTEEDTFIGWENGDDSAEKGDSYISANTGLMNRGNGDNGLNLKVYVDVAKIHIGPAYIGIKRGDTQTGKLKMDAAIRSADDDRGIWLTDVGPKDYSEGIVAGFENDVTKVDLDVRSWAKLGENGKPTYQYTDDYALALEGELKGDGIGVNGLSVKAGVSYDFAKERQTDFKSSKKTPKTSLNLDNLFDNSDTNLEPNSINIDQHVLGYSASVGYKYDLNDTFFVRPQIGFTGSTSFFSDSVESSDININKTTLNMAAGLLFGWGEIGQDKDAGVYFLNNDDAKKVTPGVGVVVGIPLPSSEKFSVKSGESYEVSAKISESGTVAARIVPSLYSGELIPGLTAAAYADIIVQKDNSSTGSYTMKIDGQSTSESVSNTEKNDSDAPIAVAFGVKYAIPVGEMTITPQAGIRFMNSEYKAFNEKENANTNKLFNNEHNNYGDALAGDDYLNLKLGVDVAGLIDNTTLSVTWTTRNIINETKKTDTTNVGKFGTIDLKAKIAL